MKKYIGLIPAGCNGKSQFPVGQVIAKSSIQAKSKLICRLQDRGLQEAAELFNNEGWVKKLHSSKGIKGP